MTKTVSLIASGDLRESANQVCWEAQREMEAALGRAIEKHGFQVKRAHAFDADRGHGFIASQREGIEVFRGIDPESPLVVAEAVWQYSHHVLAGLTSHRGPILTVANWSGQWPGLVGLLNLNGSLTKAGVEYSSLWSETFDDAEFEEKLGDWLHSGRASHETSHVRPFDPSAADRRAVEVGQSVAEKLRREKAIMGVFDEGCMGMFNAIIPDALLNPTGVFKERLSQSALYYEAKQVSDQEAGAVRSWLDQAGMTFHTGPNHETDLTDQQILDQCRMYIAAVRLADDFGCDLIGIQYQQGLKDLLPASDLVEGMLNDSNRPPVHSRDGARELYPGVPLTHFNEVDECAGLDGLLTQRVHAALGQPVENTLHDLRWSDRDRSGTVEDEVWVLEISGAVPASHFAGGWSDAEGFRQPPMYFPSGGSTIRGVSKPGHVVWSRIFVQDDRLKMDLGLAQSIELPREETERRWNSTTPQWPIMHAVLQGVSRDQMMARHKANHIQVAYADSAEDAHRAMEAKAAAAAALGMEVFLCGDV
ncbi:fucose isomerase [Roseiconus nitratireducens]|uniref:Fucose isomerase n=1 Tax=Roseiconus nitratireducens TaxID=2605748 RepID=A0A5M6DHU0_9BACT|nr:L-fucose/L-arabinose isomerase family protein [Roseiconus nitratireducens]KAA5545936.1 fucose isomerase [Roseiconus nitratireducens]